MIEINVRKTTVVKPAEKTPRESLYLSLLDRKNCYPMHNSSVHIYRPNGAANFFDPAVLIESLSKVLVHFYPMAGRYRLCDNDDGPFEVDCNEEGAILMEAESSSVVDDFGDFAPSPEFKRLVPTVDYSGGSSSYPLLLAQATYFKCGGVALGIAMEHHMADGPSAFHLVNSWSEIARGLDNISIPPFLDRTILRPRDPPQPKFQHIHAYKPVPPKKISLKSESNQNLQTSVFKMTKDRLNTMKAKAKEYGNGETNCSSFEILAGHAWKCVCKIRQVPDDVETTLYFPVNGRFSRLQPPPPAGFFGNVTFRAASVCLAGDLQSKPLGFAASLVRKTLAQMNDEYLRSEIDYLALQPNMSAIRFGSHVSEYPNFQITTWNRMGTLDADFGWGRPVYMGPGRIVFEGKAYLFPYNDGGLAVVIALEPEKIKLFEKLFYECVL